MLLLYTLLYAIVATAAAAAIANWIFVLFLDAVLCCRYFRFSFLKCTLCYEWEILERKNIYNQAI